MFKVLKRRVLRAAADLCLNVLGLVVKDDINQGSTAAHKPQLKARIYAKRINSKKMDRLCGNRFRHQAEVIILRFQ